MDRELLQTAFKMTISLGAVLLVFAAAVFLVKKFGAKTGMLFKNGGAKGQAKPIEILAQHALAPGKSLYLVRCGGKQILIGSTQTTLNTLSEIEQNSLEDNDAFESSLEDRLPGGGESYSATFANKSSLKEFSRV